MSNTNSSLVKPVRRAFYRDVVINTAGEPIDEATWKSIVTVGDQQRSISAQLSKHGMQLVHLFDRPAYETAKKEYRELQRVALITERDSLIFDSFNKANVPLEPHLERALKDLLPLFGAVVPSKTRTVFKNIIKTVASASPVSTVKHEVGAQGAEPSVVGTESSKQGGSSVEAANDAEQKAA